MLFDEPVVQNGKALLSGRIEMAYDAGVFDISFEKIVLDDPKMKNDWEKDALWLLVLTEKQPKTTGTATVSFRKA